MTREDQIKYAAQIISYGCSDELETALKQDFPELAETEDEEIRKHIIDLVKDNAKSKGIPCDAEIAYLEKQKEQKPVGRSLEDDHIIGFVYDLLNEIEWKDNWAMSKEECLGRLKSLRPPLKDKEMKLKILKYLSTRCSSLEFEEVENYLNNLRPSWKPSEDEERLINTSISFLKDFADKGYENAVECIDWLKSKLNGNTGK